MAKNKLSARDRALKSRDRTTVFYCIALSAFIFLIDLKIEWAVGSTLYVLVIILSLNTTKARYPYIFAAVVSLLTILGIMLNPPLSQAWRVLTNHGLAVVIIWVATLWGCQTKRHQETNAYLAAIIDSSDDIIYGKTLDGTIKSWNKAAQEIYGHTSEEIIGQSTNVLVPQDKADEVAELLLRIKSGKRVKHYETIRKGKNGNLVNVSLSMSPIRDAFGDIIGVSTIARDITERIQAEEKQRELSKRIELEKQKLEQVVTIEEGLNTIFHIDKLIDFVAGKTAKVLEAARCSVMLMDDAAQELIIKGCVGMEDDIARKARVKFGDPVAGYVAKTGEPVLVANIENDSRFLREKRPSYKGKSFVCVPVILNGQLMGVINVADKITHNEEEAFTEIDLKILCMIARQIAVAIENAKLYKELNYLAVTDPLTNLNNYRHFTKSLDYEIGRLQRYPGSLCLCMIDVDDFKSYNDCFGHLEGDHLLKSLGLAFRDNLRNIDIACRYAGDEFVIILPETSIDQAKKVSQKIKEKVEALELKKRITISIGIAQYHKNMSRYEFILKADTALFEAKKQGKDRVYACA